MKAPGPGDGRVRHICKVECRSCPAWKTYETASLEEAARWLRLTGWAHDIKKGWRCPDCIKAGRE